MIASFNIDGSEIAPYSQVKQPFKYVIQHNPMFMLKQISGQLLSRRSQPCKVRHFIDSSDLTIKILIKLAKSKDGKPEGRSLHPLEKKQRIVSQKLAQCYYSLIIFLKSVLPFEVTLRIYIPVARASRFNFLSILLISDAFTNFPEKSNTSTLPVDSASGNFMVT